MGDFSVNPLLVFGAGTSFAFAGLFYKLYQEKKEELIRLKVNASPLDPVRAGTLPLWCEDLQPEGCFHFVVLL